jgi:hypothetical protein
MDKAIKKGIEYLMEKQTKSGAWSRVKHPEAITSLVSLAILRCGNLDDSSTKEALRKGTRYLIRKLKPRVKRLLRRKRLPGSYKGTYYTYAFIYALEFFLEARKKGILAQRKKIDEFIKMLVKLAGKLEYKGGWIYQWGCAGPKPHISSAMILSLIKAKEEGFSPDEKMFKKALSTLDRSRGRSGGYPYMITGGRAPSFTSSMGRIAPCELALFKGGIRKRDDLRNAIKKFFKNYKSYKRVWYSHRLYGLYYLSESLALLEKDIERKDILRFCKDILKKQRRKGYWVDSPTLCGKEYGTAMGVMILGNLKKLLKNGNS